MGVTSPFGHLNVQESIGGASLSSSDVTAQSVTDHRRNNQDDDIEYGPTDAKKQRKNNSSGLHC